jgi:hypothetical protein
MSDLFWSYRCVNRLNGWILVRSQFWSNGEIITVLFVLGVFVGNAFDYQGRLRVNTHELSSLANLSLWRASVVGGGSSHNLDIRRCFKVR